MPLRQPIMKMSMMMWDLIGSSSMGVIGSKKIICGPNQRLLVLHQGKLSERKQRRQDLVPIAQERGQSIACSRGNAV